MKIKLKHYFWHGLGTLLLCILASLFGNSICSSDFFSPINKALDSFNLYDFCCQFLNEENGNEAEQEMEVNDDILLFSIGGCNSRAELAGKLQQITDLKPKVIGMDVIYGDNSVTTKAEDDSLQHVVDRCPQLVTAMRITQHNRKVVEEHSFYTKAGNVDEACINAEDGIVRNFIRELEVDGIKKQSFVDRIIQRAYPETYKEIETRGYNEARINYTLVEFPLLGMQDSLYPEDVQGKIVLIGDFDDLRDYHNIPVSLNGTSRVNGTKIHAYAINTLTNGKYIERMSDAKGLILGLIVTYIFSVIVCIFFVECDKLSGFIINLLMILFIFALSIVYGICMLKYQYEPDISSALIGVGLAGFTCEIWFWLCTTKPYLWLQPRLHLPDGGIRAFISNEEAQEAWKAKRAEKAKRKAERAKKAEEAKQAKETTKK